MTLEEMGRDWTPPEGLGYSGMRPVQLSRAGYAMAVLSAMFVIGSVILGLVLYNKSQDENMQRQRLESEGVVTEGTVTRLWHEGSKSRTAHVRYSFPVNGSTIEGSSSIAEAKWKALQVGDSIEIRYVPGSAEINHPAAWRKNVTSPWIVLLVPVSFWGCAGMFVYMIQRQWRLLSEGRPAPGVVLKRLRANREQTVVTYNFRLMNGAVQRGRCQSGRRTNLSEGSPICVLYDPDNPRRSGIYPFQFVRLMK